MDARQLAIAPPPTPPGSDHTHDQGNRPISEEYDALALPFGGMQKDCTSFGVTGLVHHLGFLRALRGSAHTHLPFLPVPPPPQCLAWCGAAFELRTP